MAKFISLDHQIINVAHIIKIEMTKIHEFSVVESPVLVSTGKGSTAYLRSTKIPREPDMEYVDRGFLIKIYMSLGNDINLDPIEDHREAKAIYSDIEQALGSKKIIEYIH